MPCALFTAAAAAATAEIGGRMRSDEGVGCWHNVSSPRVYEDSWRLDEEMVTSSRVRFTGRGVLESSRYLTVLPGKKRSRLFAKVGAGPSATPFDRMLEFRGCDEWLGRRGGDTCFEDSNVLRNDLFFDANVARNAAFFRSVENRARVLALGGEHSRNCGAEPGDPCGAGAELLARSDRKNQSAAWSYRKMAVNGHHPGCLELRRGFDRCEFDGRWSVAELGESWMVYGRANLSRRHGGRWATVAAVSQREVDAAIAENRPPVLSRFRKIAFAAGSTPFQKHFSLLQDRVAAELNIYCFAVNTNPADPRTLLAIFPVSTRNRACVAMSVSLDGSRWSPPHPLFDSQIALKGPGKTRGLDHPVDGIFVKKGIAYLYTQINVGGIAPADHPRPEEEGYPSHLVAHAIPLDILARYTTQALLSTNFTTE